MLLAIVFFVLAGGIFVYYTQSVYQNTKATRAQIAQYDEALSKATELQRLKQDLLARYNSFSPQDLDRLHKMLPDHVDNVRLVLDLDNLALRGGIALRNVEVSRRDEEELGSAIAAAAVSGKRYGSLTLSFSAQGTYNRFVSFLEQLEESLRIADITSLKIYPERSITPGAEPEYRYEIVMRTYWMK
jgi:Tfp pilus assembly protein PilO